jgi:hypothetical protein
MSDGCFALISRIGSINRAANIRRAHAASIFCSDSATDKVNLRGYSVRTVARASVLLRGCPLTLSVSPGPLGQSTQESCRETRSTRWFAPHASISVVFSRVPCIPPGTVIAQPEDAKPQNWKKFAQFYAATAGHASQPEANLGSALGFA